MVRFYIKCSRCSEILFNIENVHEKSITPIFGFHIGTHICKDHFDYLQSKNPNLLYVKLKTEIKILDKRDVEIENGQLCYRIKGFDPSYIPMKNIVEIRPILFDMIDCRKFWNKYEKSQKKIKSISL